MGVDNAAVPKALFGYRSSEETRAAVAQLVEHHAVNVVVPGSSPGGGVALTPTSEASPSVPFDVPKRHDSLPDGPTLCEPSKPSRRREPAVETPVEDGEAFGDEPRLTDDLRTAANEDVRGRDVRPYVVGAPEPPTQCGLYRREGSFLAAFCE